jgi:hypothetical protein
MLLTEAGRGISRGYSQDQLIQCCQLGNWTDRGHSTARAALIYLHGSDQRHREIAQALSDLAEAEIKRRAKRPKGHPARKASGAAGTRQAKCILSRPAESAADGF